MESIKFVGYIYCVTNIINHKQYIGQTIRSINRRWSAHKTEAKNENNPSYFHKAILKYGESNFQVNEVEKICCMNKEELKNSLNKLESKYIQQYNTIRPNGYNITPGGDTSSFTRKREILRISKHCDNIEKFDSISDALRSLNLTEGALSSVLCGYTNMSYGYYWIYANEDLDKFIKNHRIPYIAMYNEFGKLEKIYDNYSDAAKSNNIQVNRVKECCNGTRNHSKRKRFFEYYDKNEVPLKIEALSVTWGKGILQYNNQKEVIASYKNIKELLLNNPAYNACTIRNCCSGHRQSAYGYIWSYA